MKDIKKTKSWPQVAVARKAWEKAPPAAKAAAKQAYAQAVKQCFSERDGGDSVSARNHRLR